MTDDLMKAINRARELLVTVRHATMATVNQDGSPHNTPFRFLYNNELTHIFWGSHPESTHSLNILRTGQLYVVLYDAFKPGGLYLKAVNGHLLQGEELRSALKIHNQFRSKESKPPLQLNYYSGTSPQRMWSAKITNIWINRSEKNSQGKLIKDYRTEIAAADLLRQ